MGAELDLQVWLVWYQDREPRAQHRARAQRYCRFTVAAAGTGEGEGADAEAGEGEKVRSGDNICATPICARAVRSARLGNDEASIASSAKAKMESKPHCEGIRKGHPCVRLSS